MDPLTDVSPYPETREFNFILYHKKTLFRGHGEDDKAYAMNEARMYRESGPGILARAVKVKDAWVVYVAYVEY